MYPKNIGCTDGRWHGSTGISPSRGSRATLPIACDASPPESRLHARAVAVGESHYPAGSHRPRENRSHFTSSCLSLAPEITGGHGAPSAWLVADRSYPSALYCREYSARLSLSKNPVVHAERGTHGCLRTLIQVKAQDRDNQFCFQASAKFFIHIGTVVAAFVTACPPRERSYVAGIMTDYLVYRVYDATDSGLDHRVRDHAGMCRITHPRHLPSAFSAADRHSAGACLPFALRFPCGQRFHGPLIPRTNTKE